MTMQDGMEAIGVIYKNFFVGRNKIVLALLSILICYSVANSFCASLAVGLPRSIAFGVAFFVFLGWVVFLPATIYLMDKNKFFYRYHRNS